MMKASITKLATILAGRELSADYNEESLPRVQAAVARADALAEVGGHGILAEQEPTEASTGSLFAALQVLLRTQALDAPETPLYDLWLASQARTQLAAPQQTIVDSALREGDIAFSARTEAMQVELSKALHASYRALRRTIDTRSTIYLQGVGYGRVLALGILAAFLLFRLGSVVLASPNLARGKPVTASSSIMGPQGLVDGKRDGIVGAHTATSDRASFLQIDLGGTHDLRKVVVFNRGDRNLDDGLPIWIELSDDGANFHEVGRRSKRFGDDSLGAPPWTLRLHERARYVRIRSNSYLALSEVEVY